MYSRLFGSDVKVESQQKSRFSEKKESQKIIQHIEQLKQKAEELKLSSESIGPDSVDNAKYALISTLLKNFNRSIEEFNEHPAYSDSIKELQDFINLLRDLVEHLKKISDNREYMSTLSQFRNKDREIARKAIRYGVYGAMGFAMTFASVAAGASAFLVGLGGASLLDTNTNINNPLPETCRLLKELAKLLELTIKNLVLVVNLSQLDSDNHFHVSEEDNMVCPITRALMNDPVLCTLDGYSYEREALKKWLVLHRQSPMTRKYMEEGQLVADVMIPNRQLKQIIDDYRLYKQTSGSAKEQEARSPVKAK